MTPLMKQLVEVRAGRPVSGGRGRLSAVLVALLMTGLVSPAFAQKDDDGSLQTGALAIALGTPGALNVSYTSLVSDHWGVELSGGYWSRSGISGSGSVSICDGRMAP